MYWPVTHFDFVNYDDDNYITENPRVQNGFTRESLKWAFQSSHAANWHPLTWLSHMLDCNLYGLSPGGHHLTGLLLHLGNSILLFLFLKQLTAKTGRSLFVACLFAWHPLHVESVAWISERKDVLSTFFWILTLWFYARYARKEALIFPNRVFYYALSVVCFALGLMAKPMLVTLPFVLLLLDYWPLKRLWPGGRDELQPAGSNINSPQPMSVSWIGLLMEKVPFFILAATVSLVTYFAQGEAVASLKNLPLAARFENVPVAYLRYLGKSFWPVDLAVFYPHPRAWPAWQVIVAGTVLACVTLLVIRQARRSPFLPVGWFWFLGTLVPVIGLVRLRASIHGGSLHLYSIHWVLPDGDLARLRIY